MAKKGRRERVLKRLRSNLCYSRCCAVEKMLQAMARAGHEHWRAGAKNPLYDRLGAICSLFEMFVGQRGKVIRAFRAPLFSETIGLCHCKCYSARGQLVGPPVRALRSLPGCLRDMARAWNSPDSCRDLFNGDEHLLVHLNLHLVNNAAPGIVI